MHYQNQPIGSEKPPCGNSAHPISVGSPTQLQPPTSSLEPPPRAVF